MAIVIALWERHPAAIPIEAGRLSHRLVRRDAGLLPVGAVFQPRWSKAPRPVASRSRRRVSKTKYRAVSQGARPFGMRSILESM